MCTQKCDGAVGGIFWALQLWADRLRIGKHVEVWSEQSTEAVDATAWKCGAWCRSGASGDGRFWTTSAWRIFTGVALDEDLRAEYSAHLDLHSIGHEISEGLFF